MIGDDSLEYFEWNSGNQYAGDTTGRNINELRRKAGFTVRNLQNVLGFNTPQAIYKWFNGTTMPTVDNLVILAAVLGVTIEDLIVLQKQEQQMPA